jgi:Na+/H+ antiporter NhaD/arsenite permease-like protein
MAEVFAANIGGAATLIGDPPNIMIGGAAHLDFAAFLANLAPVAGVVLAVTLGLIALRHRRSLGAAPGRDVVVDRPDLHPHLTPRSVAVFAATILALALHPFALQPGLVALLGAAAALVLLPHDEVEAVLRELEWGTVFFFAGLYLLVGGLVESGAVGDLAQAAVSATGGRPTLLLDAVLWASALASAVVDNVPWAAAMIPLIHRLDGLGTADARPLWWALALGTCLGGNGTLVGASANLVMSGVLARRGKPLAFWTFTREAFPLMLVSVAISAAYLHWRFG